MQLSSLHGYCKIWPRHWGKLVVSQPHDSVQTCCSLRASGWAARGQTPNKHPRGMHQQLLAYGVGRGGGVGEGLPELKFSSIILSFKTFKWWLSIVYYLSTQFPWSEGLSEPKFRFCLYLAYILDVSGQVWPSSMINNLHENTYFIPTF